MCIFTAKYAVNNMNAIYIWQRKGWPHFNWNIEQISYKLARIRHLQGHLIGVMSMAGFDLKKITELEALSNDIVNSSEIEGEFLDKAQVRSSVARHLGLEIDGLPDADRYIDGVVQLMMDATENYQEPLTEERLFGWHSALFPTGRSGMFKITVGNWRQGDEPMQVVSGPMGRERIHYEAPNSSNVATQMKLFLEWCNQQEAIDPVIKAAIAHIWFVTIHPFDDGNGRITRTITDLFLTRADELPQRFYSMSAEIRKRKKQYYEILEKTQKGDLDITDWLEWFLDCLESALIETRQVVANIMKKASFWDYHRTTPMNERQVKIVNMLWDGFEGKFTTSKWAKIAKCSSDTALRDIRDLLDKQVLRKTDEVGRNTNYEIFIKNK